MASDATAFYVWSTCKSDRDYITCSIGVKLLTPNDIKAEPSQDYMTDFGCQATCSVQSLYMSTKILETQKSVLVLDLNLIPKIVYRYMYIFLVMSHFINW